MINESDDCGVKVSLRIIIKRVKIERKLNNKRVINVDSSTISRC
jgi:hypothetical protein